MIAGCGGGAVALAVLGLAGAAFGQPLPATFSVGGMSQPDWSMGGASATLAPSPFSAAPRPSPATSTISSDAAASSRTAYEAEGTGQAVGLAARVFHVDRSAWSPLGAAGNGKVVDYLSDRTAVVQLPDGHKDVVQSTVPLRVADPSGGYAPVSLHLKGVYGGFAPERPLVDTWIATAADGGFTLPGGVSVMPAGAAAQPGVRVGDQVLFANIASDTDFLVGPVPSGAEASWQLRSQRSPTDNELDLGLPPGASLQADPDRPGQIDVVQHGSVLVSVPPASAVDAAGRTLPVTYTIAASNVLAVHVATSLDTVFPVLVDPTFTVGYGSYGVNGTAPWNGWMWCVSGVVCPPQSAEGTNGWTFDEWWGPTYGNLLEIADSNSVSAPQYAEWFSPAPSYAPNVVSITRADVQALTMFGGAGGNQSAQTLVGIVNQASGNPNSTSPPPSSTATSTTDGQVGAMYSDPWSSPNSFAPQPMTFCAVAGGGSDGGSTPLCNESTPGGNYFLFALQRGPAPYLEADIAQMTGVSLAYYDQTPPTATLSGIDSTQWVASAPTVPTGTSPLTFSGTDNGMGLSGANLYVMSGYDRAVAPRCPQLRGQPWSRRRACLTRCAPTS